MFSSFIVLKVDLVDTLMMRARYVFSSSGEL